MDFVFDNEGSLFRHLLGSLHLPSPDAGGPRLTFPWTESQGPAAERRKRSVSLAITAPWPRRSPVLERRTKSSRESILGESTFGVLPLPSLSKNQV